LVCFTGAYEMRPYETKGQTYYGRG